MIHPEALTKLFRNNAELLSKQVVGLTQEESLLSPSKDINCINWLLGHIISSRTRALQAVGQNGVLDEAQRSRYRSGSAPITAKDSNVIELEELLVYLSLSQERLEIGLSSKTYQEMCVLSGFENNTVADSLLYFHFHETYHIGQLATVAQFYGKNGVWPF
jgi:hypothetical protein